MPAITGNAHLKQKESESSLQLPRVSTWLMGPPSSKWACLLAHCFFRIQLKQAAKTLTSHARACCHAICSFSGIRKCQKLGKQPSQLVLQANLESQEAQIVWITYSRALQFMGACPNQTGNQVTHPSVTETPLRTRCAAKGSEVGPGSLRRDRVSWGWTAEARPWRAGKVQSAFHGNVGKQLAAEGNTAEGREVLISSFEKLVQLPPDRCKSGGTGLGE